MGEGERPRPGRGAERAVVVPSTANVTHIDTQPLYALLLLLLLLLCCSWRSGSGLHSSKCSSKCRALRAVVLSVVCSTSPAPEQRSTAEQRTARARRARRGPGRRAHRTVRFLLGRSLVGQPSRERQGT